MKNIDFDNRNSDVYNKLRSDLGDNSDLKSYFDSEVNKILNKINNFQHSDNPEKYKNMNNKNATSNR
jgi:hypothetical protein